MKYLKIQNSGELDIRLVALMGGTTKANDKYKIGQFGTGLKYTLSYLFRNNIDFKVFIGGNLVDITTVTENIQGSDFDIICINGNRTSITAGMGHQWSAWMIIRELWCNALDEGSASRDIIYSDEKVVGEEGSTIFYIQITPEIQEVLDNWRKYFIQEFEPIWEDANFAIHHNNEKEHLCLYKNGVLIYQHPNTKSLFRYDIKGAEINELREFKGSVSYPILQALRKPNAEVISYFLKNVTEEHFEGSELDYDWFVQFHDVWRESLGDSKIIGKGYYEGYEDRGINVDYSKILELPKKVYKALTKNFEGIGAIAITDGNTDFFEVAFADLTERVNACINILQSCEYSMLPNVAIKYGFFQSKTTQISANRKNKCIMVSEVAMSLCDADMCALLIEYNEYLQIDVAMDNPKYSRHFINLYTRALLAKNEVEI